MLDLERRHGLRFIAYVIAKVAAIAVVLAVQVTIFRTTVELGFLLREAIGGDAPAATQIVVATLVTILVLRWQEWAVLGRNRAVR